jgi:hypothetical protein
VCGAIPDEIEAFSCFLGLFRDSLKSYLKMKLTARTPGMGVPKIVFPGDPGVLAVENRIHLVRGS